MNVPAEPLPLERFYERSRESFEDIVRYADSEEAACMSHGELERELEKRGRELMRRIMRDHLDRRGPGEAKGPVRDSGGDERTRVRLQERALETVFGTVFVERAGYGREGADSLHPLDGELNLPVERYSLELRRRVAEEAAKSSFDETLQSVEKTTGAHVPKRQLEEMVLRAARDFDGFYETRRIDPREETSSLLVISADGKGVVMRPEDLREKTREAAAKRKHKMGARLSKGEKTNAKRMATVAAVYTVAPFVRAPEDIIREQGPHLPGPSPPRPEQKRVWAKLEEDPEKVIEEAFDEALCRDPGREKKWVALVDGNKTKDPYPETPCREKGDRAYPHRRFCPRDRVPLESGQGVSFRIRPGAGGLGEASSPRDPPGKGRVCSRGHEEERHAQEDLREGPQARG